ncbi:MAG: 50S ribosomal protein L18 [Nanoarchaeota archaeon]|nr:50S ribosomal protein L18 [Nanoarchaeota archaeon]
MKRRREGKTDYKARLALLKSEKPRIVFRKTNKYIIGQYIKSKEARDKVIIGVNSKELQKYNWPKNPPASLKSISASYFTGLLLGKKIQDKEETPEVIFDIGLLRSTNKSKCYSFLKGIIDSGIKIKTKETVFPDEKRIAGEHLKNKIDFNKIKQNIEKKFV